MATERGGGRERNEENEDEDEEKGAGRPLGRGLRYPHIVRNAEHARCRRWCDGDEQLPGKQLLQREEKRRRHTGLQRCRERHRGAEMRRDNASVSPDTSPPQVPSGQRIAQTRKSRRRDGGDCWRR